MSDTPASNPEQGFAIVDEKKGLFSLYDRAFNAVRIWKVFDKATPGMWFAQDKLDESRRIANLIPDSENLTKDQLYEAIKKRTKSLSGEELRKHLELNRQNSVKQLEIICMYVDPVDTPIENGKFAGLRETKIEHLSACLSDFDDAAKIQNFFFKRLNGSTTSPGEKAETET